MISESTELRVGGKNQDGGEGGEGEGEEGKLVCIK